MSRSDILDNLVEDGNGYLCTSYVLANGISKPTLADYVNKRNMARVAHGVYLAEDAWPDELYQLYLTNRRIVFSHETAAGTTLFAASLPPVLPGLKRAAAVVNEETAAPVTVFFPAAAAHNAAVILNLAVITKIAKAVKKNEERRRTIAGLPAWTPAEANEFFTEPAGAAQSTAAFLAVV